MLIRKRARYRRSKLSVTLVNRKKAAPVRKHLSGKLFHDKTNIAGFRQKDRASCIKKKAVETAFFYSIAVALNVAAKRIAHFQLATIETALEPLGALGRCSMIKALRHHITLTAPLQRIVADLMCRVKRFFEVACFQNTLLLRVIAPYSREAIGEVRRAPTSGSLALRSSAGASG